LSYRLDGTNALQIVNMLTVSQITKLNCDQIWCGWSCILAIST